MLFENPDESREWLNRLLAAARYRARRAGMEFNLPPEFAVTLYDRQQGRCAVTGFEFDLKRYPKALVKHPFAPSIDRKLASGGYTEDNVRLVCVAVNFGMGQWGEEVFLTPARAAVDREQQHKGEDAAEWLSSLRERLAAAIAVLPLLPEQEQAKQRHRIAGLKSALANGLAGVRDAAARAKLDRQVRSGRLPR
jgi:hypothetical protein